MKRNRFRLDTVMRVRRIQEDVEVGRLTKARLDVAAAHRRVEERTERYRSEVSSMGTLHNAASFLAERDRFDRLGDHVVAAHHEVVETSDVERERLVDWSVAAQRVSALDRLLERHQASHHADLLAEEVLDADERTMQRRIRAMNAAATAPAPSATNS